MTAPSLTDFARAGFANLSESRLVADELANVHGIDTSTLLACIADSPDPDRAIVELERLCRIGAVTDELRPLVAQTDSFSRLLRVLGGSSGLSSFLQRHPSSLRILSPEGALSSPDALRASLLAAVSARSGVAKLVGEAGRNALRVRYREELLRIASFDLSAPDALAVVGEVSHALASLADATLEAAVALARADVVDAATPAADIACVRFAVIGMGKCGAQELNYISDVDVIFVAESISEEKLSIDRAIAIATKIAQHVMRIVHEAGVEPGLWEVDANLRPEGKAGALVRTLDSHVSYYERWAKNWEFQALLKARPVAGDVELGRRYVDALAPHVWTSASRPEFVEQVQRMRERVTAHIPADEVEYQIKLGPGGLRDVEFTVQLLQLVHGQTDDTVRTRGTLESLAALAGKGYVGRPEAASFAENYRFLRTLEHRIQLRDLTRTHLMPRDESAVRAIARGSRRAVSAPDLLADWHRVKLEVRDLHERLFYRPLLSAVATLPDEALAITSEQAESRLAAIGFRDPRTALTHIAALTSGLRRRSDIQRALLPVLLKWLAEGPSPDSGLLTFRRISEQLGESPWYLRMLRDSSGAAARLMTILSGSRYIANLIEHIPEAVAWLDDDADLVPRTLDSLRNEMQAVVERHVGADEVRDSHKAVQSIRQREILRVAMGSILRINTDEVTSQGLSSVMEATLEAALTLALRDEPVNPEMAIVAMGRFGGEETGFGSDADVMFVYRDTPELSGNDATRRAERVVSRIKEILEDHRLPFDLDTDLRPEGKNGVVVRSLESYAAYYRRWSLSWEAQALLRARPAVGSPDLLRDFAEVIDAVRYPDAISDDDLREIRRIKARVEKERLPQGANPTRHLKLGRGSLSDVEWLVQSLQLRHAHAFPALRTTSTRAALRAAVEAEMLSHADYETLKTAWELSSRIRSALTIWGSPSSDILPEDRFDLDGVARLVGYPARSAATFEEDFLSATRRARACFERLFYDD